MSSLTRNDEQMLASTRHIMDRYHIALAALAQGDSSLSMTKEFKREFVEVIKDLPHYPTTGDKET